MQMSTPALLWALSRDALPGMPRVARKRVFAYLEGLLLEWGRCVPAPLLLRQARSAVPRVCAPAKFEPACRPGLLRVCGDVFLMVGA